MNEEILAQAGKALDRAKVNLMRNKDSAFFTSLCTSMHHIFTMGLPTAATDGLSIWYNPIFFLAQSEEVQRSILNHEIDHVANLHMLRGEGLDQDKFNQACDFSINLSLKDRDYEIPNTWLCDEKYRGLAPEQIYKLLPDSPPQNSGFSQPCIGGSGAPGDQGDPQPGGTNAGMGPDLKPQLGKGAGPGGTDLTPAQATREITDNLIRASIHSRMAGDKPGTIPGDTELFIDKILNPVLPWDRILDKFMLQFNKDDYSFRRPNRRYFPRHILPSLYSEALVEIAKAVDISGSVSDEQFQQMFSDVHYVMKRYRPKKLTLLQFDTDIRHIDVLKTIPDLAKIKFTGRGGTQIGPILKWAKENKPPVLMILTDGEFRWRDLDPKIPVVWLIHNNPNFKAAFGKVIHYHLPE